MLAELDGDAPTGTCLPLVPRIAPGVLLANVNQSTYDPGSGFTGNSGFVTLRNAVSGGVVYEASEPFAGGATYTPTSDSIYGRLLDNTSAGMYRADGKRPRGTFVDTTPFGSAFPDNAIGGIS